MDGGIALTKFRVPRLRADTVPRAGLLACVLQSVESNPVTVVQAPGGSGKSVLLAQLCASLAGTHRVLWIAVDADDNDGNRLFAALIQAVEPLALTWDADPRELVIGVAGGQALARAALAALVNALCTATAQRIVIVLDDLHRLEIPRHSHA
jgi:LuxR family maltose regulon positive regulatory protein